MNKLEEVFNKYKHINASSTNQEREAFTDAIYKNSSYKEKYAINAMFMDAIKDKNQLDTLICAGMTFLAFIIEEQQKQIDRLTELVIK